MVLDPGVSSPPADEGPGATAGALGRGRGLEEPRWQLELVSGVHGDSGGPWQGPAHTQRTRLSATCARRPRGASPGGRVDGSMRCPLPSPGLNRGSAAREPRDLTCSLFASVFAALLSRPSSP